MKSFRYRFENGEEEQQVRPPWNPAPLAGCICPPPFVHNGELHEPHDPSCLVGGHGCFARPLPPLSIYFQDSRTVAVGKGLKRGATWGS